MATGAAHSCFGKDEWQTVAPGLDAWRMRRPFAAGF